MLKTFSLENGSDLQPKRCAVFRTKCDWKKFKHITLTKIRHCWYDSYVGLSFNIKLGFFSILCFKIFKRGRCGQIAHWAIFKMCAVFKF